MFYHLKIIIRNLTRDRLYSVIHITGLAVSLVAVIFFMLWVLDEVSYDRFNKRSKDIYLTNNYLKEMNGYWSVASAPLAFTAKEEIPEIENACRYYANWGMYRGFNMLRYVEEGEDQIVTDFTCGMVDTTFFSIFDFPVLEGDARRMLDEPQSIYHSIKFELQLNPAIAGVTVTSAPLKSVTSIFGISDIEGSDLKDQRIVLLSTDQDFIPAMNVNLAAGRNFDGTPADATGIMLNETAVKTLGLTDPVGKTCRVANTEGTIIGIVSDFHFKDLHSPIEPLAIMANEYWKYSFMRTVLYLKTSAHNASQAIAAVEKLWKQYEADLPFTYQFIDDEFDMIYKTDLRTGILFRYFAMIAILISCLGLFGLVTYTAETKTKEIGIRKVLGASVKDIVTMLSKEFLILVGIAMLIAFPLAYYWLDRILQSYAYRIDIQWWMFALTGIITVVLTILTVGWQAIKAATADPVKAIKSE